MNQDLIISSVGKSLVFYDAYSLMSSEFLPKKDWAIDF